MNRSRPSGAQLLLAVAHAGALVVIVALAAWPMYETPRVALVAAVGAVAGIGAAAIGGALGWRSWQDGLLAFGLYLAAAVPVAIPSALASPERTLLGLRDAALAPVVGWKQLVTLELPLGEYQAVLAPLLVVILGGAYAVTRLGLARARAAFWAVVVALAMIAFPIAFGASRLGEPLVVPLAAPFDQGFAIPGWRLLVLGLLTVVVSLAWLAARSRVDRAEALSRARGTTAEVRLSRRASGPAARRAALGLGMVVLAIVAGIAVAPAAADAERRQTIRDAVDPRLLASRFESPLADYRSWFAGEAFDATIFTVTGDPVERIRLATLPEYDGVRFEVGRSDRFVRLAGAQPPAGAQTVRIEIGEAFRGPWVPVPGSLAGAPAFDGDRADELADALYVAPGGATAVDVAPAEDGGTGLRPGDVVTVTGVANAGLGSLASSPASEPRIDLERHPALVEWVDEQRLPRDGAALIELVERLRARGYLSHARAEDEASAAWIQALRSRADYVFEPSLAGHSVARIESLFTELNDQAAKAGPDAPDELLVAAVGDDEQFATAAALIARYLGFESRVVLGVVLESDDESRGVEPCDAGVCTGGNLTAWIEVLASDGTWVALDATPQFASPISVVAEGEIPPEHPTVPDDPESELLNPPAAVVAESEDAPADEEGEEAWLGESLPALRIAAAAVVAAGCLVLPLATLLAAKGVRRASRRRGEPEVAIVGAWDELVDTWIDYRLMDRDAGTRVQLARRVGRPAAHRLARIADRAVFGEQIPGDADRDAAWAIVREERKALSAGVPFWQRMRATLTPASFARRVRGQGAAKRPTAPSGRST